MVGELAAIPVDRPVASRNRPRDQRGEFQYSTPELVGKPHKSPPLSGMRQSPRAPRFGYHRPIPLLTSCLTMPSINAIVIEIHTILQGSSHIGVHTGREPRLLLFKISE